MSSIGWKTWSAVAALFTLACSESHGNGTTNTRGPGEMFAFPVRIPLGPGFPGHFARGDLDNDELADVAVPLTDFTGLVPSSVVLSYLDGRGHSVRTVELMDAREPVDVAISDCNGDGRADVLVLDAHGEVLVHLQASDGTFGVAFPFAVGERPTQMIVARWDGDATSDVLTVNEQGRSVCVLRGRGDGTFEPARFTEHGAFSVRDAAAGDLDQDGARDLVLTQFNGAFLLFGSGDGRFGTPQPIAAGFGTVAVRVADVTGDGFPDIVESSCNSFELTVLEGDGAGNFALGFTFSGCGIAEIGDLDGDGVVDLVLASQEGIRPLFGLGGGDFAPGPTTSVAGSQREFALWDVDDDLDLDLVSLLVESDGISQAATDLTVLLGKGDGTFEGPAAYTAALNGRALVLGDFVRDGVPDLAVIDDTPTLSVLGGVGDGSFLARITTPLPSGGAVLASADLDGNTLEDVLYAVEDFFGGELVLLSSTGSGTFDPPSTFSSGGLAPTAIRVADLDSNLFPDLVVSNSSSNQLAVHIGMPGGFSKPLRFGVGAFPRELELDDLDGDGLLDAVVANNSEDSVSVLIGNGDGTFQPDVVTPAFDGPNELEIGDFDEDGFDDLAVACVDFQGGSEVILLSGMGDGTFTPRQLVPDVPAGVFALNAADLNRDGLLDLVTSSSFGVFLQIADGAASYEPPRTFATTQFIGGVKVEDLDADGRADLVLVAGSQALVFLNQGP